MADAELPPLTMAAIEAGLPPHWREEHRVDADIVRDLLFDMHEAWTDGVVEPSDLLGWCSERFGIDLSDPGFGFLQLHNVVLKRIHWAQVINRLCDETGLYAEDGLSVEMMQRVFCVIKSASNVIFEQSVLFQRIDTAREINLPDRQDRTLLDALPMFADRMSQQLANLASGRERLNPFQDLALHLYAKLSALKYRRKDEYCYEEIVSKEGFRTHAWKQVMSIKDFVYTYVTKETDFVQWQNLTNPAANGSLAAEFMKTSKDPDFPELKVNRYLYAYANGLYHTLHDMFYPFKDKPAWEEMAAEIQTYRRLGGWGEAYVAIAPTLDDVAVQFFDIPFRFAITPEAESSFDPLLIETPELDSIFATQKLDEKTIMWAKTAMGRCLFPVRKLDGWDVILFFKGVAGCGKSTLALLLKSFFPPHLVGTLSSNIEQKFGLSAIYDKLLCICSEVREDFGLDQGDWQSCASGEAVSIAIKNQTAITKVWDTPMFLAGNELPKYRNNSGSVDRRLLLFEFNEKVNVEKSDPQLFKKLLDNTDRIMRQLVALYHAAVREHSKSNVWKQGVLPQQIHDFRNNARRIADPLYSFLTQQGVWDFNVDKFMLLDDFRVQYTDYCKKHGVPVPRWTTDHYNFTFKESHLSIQPGQRSVGGVLHNGPFILGLQPKDPEEEGMLS